MEINLKELIDLALLERFRARSDERYARGDHEHPHDDTKVDKVEGKGLSANDYTNEDKTKLAGIEAGAQVNPDLSGYATKTELADKADASALAGKVDKVEGKGLSTNDYTNTDKAKLAGIETGAQVNPDLSGYATKAELSDKADASALAGKVDKVEGKGLSTNDYTNADKTKLAGIEAGAQKNPDLSGYATTEQVAQAVAGKADADDVHNLPSGGTAGQVLVKASAADYDATWTDASNANVVVVKGHITGIKEYPPSGFDAGYNVVVDLPGDEGEQYNAIVKLWQSQTPVIVVVGSYMKDGSFDPTGTGELAGMVCCYPTNRPDVWSNPLQTGSELHATNTAGVPWYYAEKYDSSGGGDGGGMMRVTFTDNGDGTITADKGYYDIYDHITQNGGLVYGLVNGGSDWDYMLVPLVNMTADEAQFRTVEVKQNEIISETFTVMMIGEVEHNRVVYPTT